MRGCEIGCLTHAKRVCVDVKTGVLAHAKRVYETCYRQALGYVFSRPVYGSRVAEVLVLYDLHFFVPKLQ